MPILNPFKPFYLLPLYSDNIFWVKNKYIYKHRDTEDLKKTLKQFALHGWSGKKILIVTDGVFSMDGDLAPLPEIVKLAKKYGAITMVDDAHGEGVLGRGGRGIVDHFGLHPSTSLRTGGVDIEVGTLSKAFSVMGGFITGKKELIDFYKQKSRQFLFSKPFHHYFLFMNAVRIINVEDYHGD